MPVRSRASGFGKTPARLRFISNQADSLPAEGGAGIDFGLKFSETSGAAISTVVPAILSFACGGDRAGNSLAAGFSLVYAKLIALARRALARGPGS
jgi:hypothetical protein